MKSHVALLALALLAPFIGPALAQPVVTLPPMSTITFAPGANVSTVTGQIEPGGRGVYYVPAKAGQTLSVSITSAAGLTFQVFRPDAAVAKGADGTAVVSGRTLPDAGPADNAKAWIGAIPSDGNYVVLVGGGGAGTGAPMPYSLTVSRR